MRSSILVFHPGCVCVGRIVPPPRLFYWGYVSNTFIRIYVIYYYIILYRVEKAALKPIAQNGRIADTRRYILLLLLFLSQSRGCYTVGQAAFAKYPLSRGVRLAAVQTLVVACRSGELGRTCCHGG